MQRSGQEGGQEIVAIPTTLGTGAERSAAACVAVAGRRRLILGQELRADRAVYHPSCYETVGEKDLRRALLEVALRLLGPYVVSSAGPADRLAAKALAGCLRLMGGVIGKERDALRDFARISGATHGPAFTVGRRPFSSPLWYLANEVSCVAGVTKMEAHEALAIPCLEAIGRFGGAWGSEERLHALLRQAGWCADGCRRRACACAAALVEALVGGPGATLDYSPEDAARLCEERWGLGLPALGGVPRSELVAVLRIASSRTQRNTDDDARLL
jgi:NADP-dependent alcohol dehydrogenase